MCSHTLVVFVCRVAQFLLAWFCFTITSFNAYLRVSGHVARLLKSAVDRLPTTLLDQKAARFFPYSLRDYESSVHFWDINSHKSDIAALTDSFEKWAPEMPPNEVLRPADARLGPEPRCTRQPRPGSGQACAAPLRPTALPGVALGCFHLRLGDQARDLRALCGPAHSAPDDSGGHPHPTRRSASPRPRSKSSIHKGSPEALTAGGPRK